MKLVQDFHVVLTFLKPALKSEEHVGVLQLNYCL